MGCSSETSSSSNQSDNENQSDFVEVEGMVQLKSGSVSIGSNDKSFKANERPAMKVQLDYDFYMGIHEVSCGEYRSVASKAKLKTFGKCENDSIPLTDITYYDAILFANAKSKQDNLDTAYTYSKPLYDDDGHCTEMEGFAFHPEANAFRLPTEAEWVYAASLAWDVKKSWNSDNSDYKLHPVCSIGTDSTGFCDMAGNAMEWVNDWLGLFHDTTVTNYVGAPDGGDLGERIVKGGRYSSTPKELNPYSRGDVYTVTSATRADYVGFRLAFGKIPNPLWMGDDGKSQSSVITPLAQSETLKKLTGTYNVKLSFRNDISGNIAYIDYLNGTVSVKEITKNVSAYHPEISPDGNWIAYCTGFEGVSGKSTIYVQNLDTENPIKVKLKTESAAIPRWQVLENGDTAIVYVNDAGNNKENATFKGTSTWQVKFKNGKFGKPQKLFDGAYHGGISEDRTLAVSGTRILRARVAKKGSTITDKASDIVWYDSAQACNVSLSQDGTKRTAFLDFGGKPGKKFVGESYATHERVLIADSTGKLVQSLKAPTGYTFDHTEWATNGEKSIIVATLSNANGAHTKVVLINPTDSSITEIVEGEEVWHPNLWVKRNHIKYSSSRASSSSSAIRISSSNSSSSTVIIESSSSSYNSNISSSIVVQEISSNSNYSFELDPDSAGAYYRSSGPNRDADQWRYKMEFLWQYKDTANLVVLGSSRAYHGINPMLFSTPFFAINLGVSRNAIAGTHYLFNHYVLPHVKNLKYVVLTVDNDLWNNTESFFTSDYKSYPGYVYDANHNFWIDHFPEQLVEYTYESLGNSFKGQMLRKMRGYYDVTSCSWGKPAVEQDSNWLQKRYKYYYENFEMLKDLAKTCFEHNIVLIGIITPRSPQYKETGSFGYHGLLRSEAPALIQEIADIGKTYPNFILMDENKMGDHDYTEDMAFDFDHLNRNGAAQLTARVDSLLKTLE